MMMNRKVGIIGAMLGAAVMNSAVAGEVGTLTTFTAGTPAVAAEVNGNFSAVASAVNGNAADIASHAGNIAGNTAGIETNAANISTNTSNVATNSSAINAISNSKPGIDWAAISTSSVDMTSAVNVGSVTLSAPVNGYVLVRFDGQACPSVGDRMVLAASDTSANWVPNDGNVGVYNDGSTTCYPFSHSRVYSVTAGDKTFYAVAQNYVQTAGNGTGSVYGMLTAEFYADRY